ncbi:hypothetical protein AUC71_04295 [Methyloceanibacter marginalis]|uniref:Uncharacterized protein n=1 Tax=Methyloceanibacter marginalis TaxID=1774971 RepID=A0A1E3VTD8_9HYPH|nr:hypothetical protein [Methyloceanibacter marginalis]ODR96793.1 hypothetical protein AUC71_04295 [Methyloceanibacter marginalis]
MLKNAPVIPSHTDREHAHFRDQALGEIKSPFLLGGYMADTILHLASPFYWARCKAMRAGTISSDAPRWMLTTFGTTLDSETVDGISGRWEQSDALLSITGHHEPSLTTAYPATRQGHIAHFQAARREYPIYEAFMTRTALEIGFEIPIKLKEQHPKHAFYAPDMEDLLSG